MANMEYCRFTNTLSDLRDCLDHLDDEELSEVETKARARLIKMCVDVALSYGEDVGLPVEIVEG